MSKPIVAIVGRPNVGKSTLVNRLAQDKAAIVHESRGVTRDRSYHDADWAGHAFTLIDTGGIESEKSDDVFASSIKEQAISACDEACAIIFVVDGSVGITDEDEAVARILRKTDRPVFLVVNKLDTPNKQEALWEFYALGLGEPRALSALHGYGTGDLLDEVVACFPEQTQAEQTDNQTVKVALIGRPNAGKSSLLNRISRSSRAIVSDVAGTTRDNVDICVEHDGVTYQFVDTAGMRKRTRVKEDIEYYSTVRGLRAMDDADVCLLVVDATIGVTEQDQKIARMACDRGCGLVVLLNKWDLVEDEQQREDIAMSLARRMTFASWAPVLRISALTGKAINRIWDAVVVSACAHASRVSTAKLNNILAAIRESGRTIIQGQKRLKINYATQPVTNPPTFTFFCNHPELVDDNFKRFLENRLRENFDLCGTPIRFHFRKKGRE